MGKADDVRDVDETWGDALDDSDLPEKGQSCEEQMAEWVEPQEKIARVCLKVTEDFVHDEILHVVCDVAAMTFLVRHSFGPDARYAGRRAEQFVDVRPRQLAIELKVPLANLRSPAAPIEVMVEEILDRLIVGVEVAVMKAETRIKEGERIAEEIEEKKRLNELRKSKKQQMQTQELA